MRRKYIISFDISADKEVNAAVSVKSGTASHELIKFHRIQSKPLRAEKSAEYPLLPQVKTSRAAE